MQFKDKVTIITGGASGIGAGIVDAFAAAGAIVHVADINYEGAQAKAKEVIGKGYPAYAEKLDTTDDKMAKELAEKIHKTHGKIDILVNNAGIDSHLLAEHLSVFAWRRLIDVNLTGYYIMIKAVMPFMMENRYGKIVNVSSTASKRISYSAGPDYTSSKYGVIGLTRHLGFELAAYGINVNAVSPGSVATQIYQNFGPEQIAKRTKLIPIGKMPTPQDEAQAVMFLCSDAASMICGVDFAVDGGSCLGWVSHEDYTAARESYRLKHEQKNN